MSVDMETRQALLQKIMELPPESLRDVEQFLDFLRFKQEKRNNETDIALGGILAGYRFTEEEIAEARREMWSGLDDGSR